MSTALLRSAHQTLTALLAMTLLVLVTGHVLAASPPDARSTFSAATTDFSRCLTVQAKPKPKDPWQQFPTRTVSAITGFSLTTNQPIALDLYGGRMDRTQKATGFFYPKQMDGRWWLIDPEGHLFLNVGVVSVNTPHSPSARKIFEQRFGSDTVWAKQTFQMLREHGFNGAGAWSSDPLIRKAERPLVYTPIWNFMSEFGRELKVTHQASGHSGYLNDCIPVFHPGFEAFCDQRAAKLDATQDDPWLLGHFSDNEMPEPLLRKYLALDPNHSVMGSSYQAAYEFLAARKGRSNVTTNDVTLADTHAFAEVVWDRYFKLTTGAIRKHDPHHLCLGSRFYSMDKHNREPWAAAGRYLDVVSVNYYGAWTPDPAMMRRWADWSGKPFIITEWYAKGDDVGFSNTGGAGWVVPTQKERGLFYQNFTLGLLESKVCVGWHWFKLHDNDPAEKGTDPSNRDSNKGLLTLKLEPYTPLMDAARQVNVNVYSLADRFDSH